MRSRTRSISSRRVFASRRSSRSGRTGRVQAHLAEAIGGRSDMDIYLCGLQHKVDDVRQILKGMGFDRKQIRYEKYD